MKRFVLFWVLLSFAFASEGDEFKVCRYYHEGYVFKCAAESLYVLDQYRQPVTLNQSCKCDKNGKLILQKEEL